MKKIEDCSVLVTGATGFIGRYLIKILLLHHVKITVLVRDRYRCPKSWENKIKIVEGNLLDEVALQNACQSIDIVFHLAGIADSSNSHSMKENTHRFRVNVVGTSLLVNVAGNNNIKKFVFFSSVKAMGSSANHCVDEKWKESPDTQYGIDKLKAEKYLNENKKLFKEGIVILRPSVVYGPGAKNNLANMIVWVKKGFFPPIQSVDNKKTMVHIDDLINLTLLASVNDKIKNETYVVTDGRYYSTREIYELVKSTQGKKIPSWNIPYSLVLLVGRVGDVLERLFKVRFPLNTEKLNKLFSWDCYDSSKIFHDLGFVPNYNLQKWLEEESATTK